MSARTSCALFLVLGLFLVLLFPGPGNLVLAQAPAYPPAAPTAIGPGTGVAAGTPAAAAAGGAADSGVDPAEGLRVTKGTGVLPNDSGQTWREYDISSYTSKITSTENPQQAITDWILRETGTEIWFGQPLGLLSATREKLTVYHTPEMQRIVAGVVARFVNSEAETHVLSLRLVTVGSPNWRSLALPLLNPVDVQSPGIDAWLLSKENAAVLLAQLRQRVDFLEHNSPRVLIQNGQSQTLSRLRPQTYVRGLMPREGGWPGQDLQMGQLQEGYTLQISPLMSTDARTVDAVIKCNIDQVERLVPVAINVPGVGGTVQRTQIQVPQMVSWRLHERFRWPADQMLLLSCGVVATPGPQKATTLGGIPNLFATGGGRADALLFIESAGKASQALVEPLPANASGGLPQYRGRY